MALSPLVPVSGIQSVLTQLRSHRLNDGLDSVNQSDLNLPGRLQTVSEPGTAASKSFATVFKESLDQVGSMQDSASKLGERFIKGDAQVSLSDTMIASQKASISLQTAVQIRNRFVSAYQNIMNMQV
jgi:flagellar hook-basal body complex protein FliE